MSPSFDPIKTAAQIYPILEFRDKVAKAIAATIEKIPGLEALPGKDHRASHPLRPLPFSSPSSVPSSMPSPLSSKQAAHPWSTQAEDTSMSHGQTLIAPTRHTRYSPKTTSPTYSTSLQARSPPLSSHTYPLASSTHGNTRHSPRPSP